MVTRDPTTARLPHLWNTMTLIPPPKIEIMRSAVDAIAREARASADGTETGGILLGTVEHDTHVIRHAGGPGPNATRQPDFFQRDLNHAQRLGDAAFDEDHSIWIGDWHTHLGAPPVPSTRDLGTYQGLLADPELGFSHFIAIILAASTGDWTAPDLATWVITTTSACAATPRLSGSPRHPNRSS